MEDEEILPIATSTKDSCIERFKELWDVDELNEIIEFISPNLLKIFALSDKKISNANKLAEILYDSVGSRFLRDIEGDTNKRRSFLFLLVNSAIKKNIISQKQFVELAIEINPTKEKKILSASNDDVINYITFNVDATSKWTKQVAIILGFPTSVAEKDDSDEEFIPHETILPSLDLNPLYDYQYTTGLEVRKMLEGKIEDKRILISVPTGAGKTRMIVETLIEWLNDGKPSTNEQQSNSKFILWIAQKRELCEQATSAFKTTFQSRGRNGTVLHLHRYWDADPKKELPISFEKLEEEYSERSIIISTIQSLNAVYRRSPQIIERLSDLTSCIVIDEAHHSVADSYRDFLEKMGFNINLRKQEMSTKGIVLIGLTATPFRGSGDNIETQQLLRRFGRLYFPTIPNYENEENFKPHALIDCQSYAQVEDEIQIIGERSYDRDGFIKKEDFKWKITKIPSKISEIYSNSETTGESEWTFEKIRNIDFSFPAEGEYKISLEVTDNEGDRSEASTYIKIKPKSKDSEIADTEKQKWLYRKLIKRKILCEVFHYILKSDQIQLDNDDLEHFKKFKEFKNETIKQIGKNESRNQLILKTIHDVKSNHKRNKILFFGCSIDHSRHIARSLRIIYNINAEYVDSKMNIDQRVSAIEKFKNGDVEVLCNYDVLTTGFDAPNINCVFVGRPIHSTLLYTQIIGRGLRGTKSGGTDDVLLIDIDDNFQLSTGYGYRGGLQDISSLGWKVFSEYWKPWSEKQPEIKFEPEMHSSLLKITCEICGNSGVGIEEIKRIFDVENDKELFDAFESKKWSLIPNKCKKCYNLEVTNELKSVNSENNISQNKIASSYTEPIEQITKDWPRCGKIANSNQIEELFGYRTINDKRVPQSHCRECRSEEKRSPSQCPFVYYMQTQKIFKGNYQMILGLYAINTQRGSLPNSNFSDACDTLIKFNPGKNKSQINRDHPVFGVYLKNKLIKKFDPETNELVFEKILSPDIFEKLCNEKLESYNKQISSIITESQQEKLPTQSSEEIDKHFYKLKNIAFGHIPTTLQFEQCTSNGILDLMNHLYGNYHAYLKSKGEIIKQDENLKDSLFEEYFELYLSTHAKISQDTLDEYGNYRLDDYVEAFGSIDVFNEIISEISKKLTEIVSSINVDDIFQDYDRIKSDLGHVPHFEEIRMQSYLGVEYYIEHFGTYGKFKKIFNLNPDDRYLMYNIRNSFFKLKETLRVTPNYVQMRKYCGFGQKFEQKFSEHDYPKLLKDLGETGKPFDELDVKLKQEIQNEFKERFSNNSKNFGDEKAIKILHDEDSAAYDEWFSSKELFLSEHLNRNDLLNMYLLRKKQKVNIHDSEPALSSEILQNPTCPQCNSNLHRIEGGVVCSNSNCDYYRVN